MTVLAFDSCIGRHLSIEKLIYSFLSAQFIRSFIQLFSFVQWVFWKVFVQKLIINKVVFGVTAENSNDKMTQLQMLTVTKGDVAYLFIRYTWKTSHLAVHLENAQRVYFTSENVLQRADRPPSTILTWFFEMCENDNIARILLYSETPRFQVPGYQQVFSIDALTRLYTVHPSQDDCFHLGLLLVNVRGELLTVNCKPLGLLENDTH